MEFIQLDVRAKNRSGLLFGDLVIHGPVGRGKNGDIIWRAKCNCGGTIDDRFYNMKNFKGCGCHQKDSGVRSLIHGHATSKIISTPTYNSWQAMRARCLNPNHHKWDRYGGRGITICVSWNDFSCFLKYMGERPYGLTLDRINPDGNYKPDNCRWADAHTQRHNRSLLC